MSLLRTSITAAKGLRPLMRPNVASHQMRFMSVQILEGSEDVEKFRMVNSKSILYFTATWCPPCKVIKPIYEDMSKENTDVAFGLVDVDDNNDSAVEFEINAVPTFIFFDGEKAVEKMTGADKSELIRLVADLKSK